MENQKLTVSLIQTHLHWEDAKKNMLMFEEWFKKIPAETDIVVLPEMFSTGFSMNTQHSFSRESEIVQWIEKQSEKLGGKMIMGSAMYHTKQDTFVNMFFTCEMNENAKNEGRYGFQEVYAKRHLFRMANENKFYTAGEKKARIQIKGFNICPLVCYDLRFPVWSANTFNAVQQRVDYDVYIYVANWPVPRIRAWDTLLPARAVENWAFSIGVNRIGTDGNGIEYCGHSAVYDFKGEQLIFADNQEGIFTVTLDKQSLDKYRQNFPAYLDSDEFYLKQS
jgi:predicted amidohydrolase